MQEISLLVSVASCRDWKPQFGISLALLADRLASNRLGGTLARVRYSIKAQASCLSISREEALTLAEKDGFTHWLSLDDDMGFPPDAVDRLIKHDLPIVAANYRRKQKKVAGICLSTNGEVINSEGKTGLEEVGWIGGGCSLVDVEKVKVVRPPRFSVLWVEERKSYMSEDYFFSMKLRENGIKIFCDHDLSNDMQHIGDVAYTFPEEVK